MERSSGSDKRKAPRSRTTAMGLRFWEQAKRDLETARMLLAPRTAYAATHFAQQAAEKALKGAYWHLLGEEPPWRHDLSIPTARLAEVVGGLPAEVDRAVNVIMPLFDRGRYPSRSEDEPIPAELIGERDAEMALKSAEEVMAWVQTLSQWRS